MSVILKKDTKEFVLDSDYEMNFIRLDKCEKEHTHRFVEMVYTLSGRGRHTVDGKEYAAKRGDLLIINYHSNHTVTPIEDFYYVDIMLKPEYLNETLQGTEDIFLLLQLRDFSDLSNSVIKDNVFLHFDGEDRERIEFLIGITREEQERRDAPAAESIIRSALTMLLNLVFRKMTENQSSRLSVDGILLEYIKKNCHSKLPISEMAAKCGYTPEHFSRLFKKHTGRAPMDYLTDCRIEKAKDILINSDRSVETVMAECGFSNRTAFFKAFFERMQFTPLQFRKNQK